MEPNMLGPYGEWAAGLTGDRTGELSLRSGRFRDLDAWREKARAAVSGLLRAPAGAAVSDVRVTASCELDGLAVEELSWQLPYGPRTEAFFLKPAGARGPLPGMLALHDHGGVKHFGKRKIARPRTLHPFVRRHQEEYYGGVGWANEIARRGFAVLVHDTFPFESRKIPAGSVPGLAVERLMSHPLEVRELTPQDMAAAPDASRFDVPAGEPEDRISAYNAFGQQHEGIIAKSLFCAGTTWPGVTLSEDRAALGYLASRPEVDAGRLACGGLSGGGMRTCFLAGMDDRVKAALCAGFMTTWRDFLLAVSHTHTWMVYVPGLPPLLDFPELLGLRAPLPTLVMATTEDPLFTRTETERAAGILREVYAAAGAPDAFRFSLHGGPHAFTRAMQREAFDWIGGALGAAAR
jgi:dienelactone hydrolase